MKLAVEKVSTRREVSRFGLEMIIAHLALKTNSDHSFLLGTKAHNPTCPALNRSSFSFRPCVGMVTMGRTGGHWPSSGRGETL